MDPTKSICRVYNTFEKRRPSYDPATLPQPFILEEPVSLTLRVGVAGSEIPVYCDIPTYNQLKDVTSRVLTFRSDVMNYDEAAVIADPFGNIGNSVFGREDEVAQNSLKIANIDAIYKLTGHYSSLLKMRLETTYEYVGLTQSPAYSKPVGLFKEDKDFIGCIVQDIGWAATNYLQFRVKNARIYAMNPILEDKYFNTPSTKYFTPTYGEDGTGDIISNWKFLAEMIRSRIIEGVNLCIANGTPENLPQEQPFILSEILVGVISCGVKASFVIKVHDVLSQFYAELLYVLAQCFGSITLFKPVTCPPETGEKYLICLERRGDDVVGAYVSLLEKVFEKSFEGYVSNFLKEKISKDFGKWLSRSNTHNLNAEIEALERIQGLMQGEDPTENYNLKRALKVWSVPGDVPKIREYNNI